MSPCCASCGRTGFRQSRLAWIPSLHGSAMYCSDDRPGAGTHQPDDYRETFLAVEAALDSNPDFQRELTGYCLEIKG